MAKLDPLLRELILKGGSDLHLSAERRPMLRIDGEMQPSSAPAQSHADVNEFVRELMDQRANEEYGDTSDADFAYEIMGLARFRVNVFEDRFGMGAVFRQIPSRVRSADELNLPQSVRDFCDLSKGLVVVTGPTGSGKSTTLAAMIDLINETRSDHIITIEDPIEFVHKDKNCLVNQRQVKDHTRSFSSALRAALRQDPDIVMVGEMRDLETIEIALETAETGHLVFGTLHTTTAASTVDRIIDAFPADRQNQIRSMLSNSLKGAVSQTLCKKIGGGRVAALEVLKVDTGISSLIRDGKIHQIPSAMQMGGSKGMKLLNSALAELVKKGEVEPEEAYRRAIDKEDIVNALAKVGHPLNRATAPTPPPASEPETVSESPEPDDEDKPKKRRGFFSS